MSSDAVSASGVIMTSSNILPLYTRHNSSFLLRRAFRSRAKIVITLLCIPLFFLWIGMVTTLFKGKHVYEMYLQVQSIGDVLTSQPTPSAGETDNSNNSNKIINGDAYIMVVNNNASRERDRNKLLEKVIQSSDSYLAPEYSEKERNHSQSQDSQPVVVTQGGEDVDPIARQRRNKVKEMLQHAWRGYRTYAWGQNEFRPVSKRGHNPGMFGSQDMGATIVDSLSTLYIMGLMEEFNEAKEWVRDHLNFDKLKSDVSVFEINIRFVGGLLSAFALTGETVFKERALQIAQKLLPAFNTGSGIPYGVVHTGNGRAKNHHWASGGSSILSEFGTLHLEFIYLSDVSGQSVFRDKVLRIRDVVQKIHSPGDLFPNYIRPQSGAWGQHHTSIGAFGDSFYEYLIKAYIQSNWTDTVAKDMYEDAIGGITNKLIVRGKDGFIYLAQSMGGSLMHKMEHLTCFAGGMYALGATTLKSKDEKQHMEIAEGLAQACHESYTSSKTGLGPEAFRIVWRGTSHTIVPDSRQYILRPEVVETWFYLWRITKNQKYRDWAWDFAMALEKHCRVSSGGFSGVRDVYNMFPQKDDVQQSFLLAETFKYLYLIFSDDSLISLDQWVFNTEAHPLPIKGVNPLYQAFNDTNQVMPIVA